MSNDQVYYQDLEDLAERIAMGLQNRSRPLDELSQTMQALSSSQAIQGQAAASMQAYIQEVHLPLIQTLQLALTNYQMAVGQYVHGYLEVDASQHFQLVREDLKDSQSKLSRHRSQYSEIAQQLSSIANEAAGLINLGGAGSRQLKQVISHMDEMKRTSQQLLSTWDSYEASDPGFNQVSDLVQQTRGLIKQTLHVPRGYSYQTGSFRQLMGADFLEALAANQQYAANPDHQKEFTRNWNKISRDYAQAQKRLAEAKAKKQAKEAGLWGLVTDALQTIAGVTIAAVGLGLSPFSGGLSWGLVALGGSLALGGFNSAVNHGSMAISGRGYNLVGQLANGVGNYYNHTLGKSLGQSGVGGFANGVLTGTGALVAGTAEFNVADTAKGIYSLATDYQAQAQFGRGVGQWWQQLKNGNVYVAGQTTANVASLFGGGAVSKVGRLDEAISLVSTLGKARTTLVSKGTSFVSNWEGKLSQLSEVMKANPRVAFAGAGEQRSLLKKVEGFSGESGTSSVGQSFNKVTNESRKVAQAKKDLQVAISKSPKPKYVSGNKPEDILKIQPDHDRGVLRPNVEDYLKPSYIKAHKALFKDGAARFQKFPPSKNWNDGILGGNDGNSFWLPKKQADLIEKVANGDNHTFEHLLGMPEGYLGDHSLNRIDVPPEIIDRKGISIPSGNEQGANEFWVPGGKTQPGGLDEAVMNGIGKEEGDYTWHALN